MPIDEINTKLGQVALDKCEGFPFERFINDFLAAIEGKDFVPIGGSSDGGADGIQEQGLYSVSKSEVFYQISIEKNQKSKGSDSIERRK